MGVCLIFGISSPPARHKQRCYLEQGAAARWDGEREGGGTWVRQPKPGSLGQNIPTSVRPSQVAIGGGVRREDVGHRQQVAEQPAQGEPQQHLPITRTSGVQLGHGRVSGTAVGDKASPCLTLSPGTWDGGRGMAGSPGGSPSLPPSPNAGPWAPSPPVPPCCAGWARKH